MTISLLWKRPPLLVIIDNYSVLNNANMFLYSNLEIYEQLTKENDKPVTEEKDRLTTLHNDEDDEILFIDDYQKTTRKLDKNGNQALSKKKI